MPFPSSPTNGQTHTEGTRVWVYSTAQGRWNRQVSGGGNVINLRLTSLNATDDFIALRDISGTPTAHLVAASVVGAYGGGASAPAVMVAGDWTLTPIAGGFAFDIDVEPANGGSPLTGYEYSTNNGSTWAALSGGAALGVRNVTGLSPTPYSCRVRAVNAIGAAPDPGSDTKTGTPLAGGITYIDFGGVSNAGLVGMDETVNGGGGFDYEGTAADGYAAASDYSIADEGSGGWKVQIGSNGASNLAMTGLYTTNGASAWDANVFVVVYAFGTGNYLCTRGSDVGPYQDLTGGATVPHIEGDWIRYRVTDEDLVVDVARAATPNTWIPLGSATIAHSTPVYPRLISFGGAGPAFGQPQVVAP